VGYLTPDEDPIGDTCRVLFIPDSEQFLAILRGALQELTFPYNWTKHGDMSPEAAAERCVNMFDRFCFGEGACRVIGEIITYGGNSSPDTRWLVCDGAEYLRSDYPDLYNVIGDAFGSSDASHFNVPDMRGRTPSGVGTGSGLDTITLGEVYGEQDHTLTIAEMPAHVHSTGNSALLGTSVPPPLDALGPNPLPAYTGSEGGDGSHNNVGPRLGITFLIVAED